MENNRPSVGVAVIVLRDNKFLLGERKCADGHIHWTLPGGRIEFGESFRDCALREIGEENGLEVRVIDENPVAVTNDFICGEQYVSLFLRAKYISGEPKVKETDNFKRWEWFSPEYLPSPLSPTVKNLIELGYNPFA